MLIREVLVEFDAYILGHFFGEGVVIVCFEVLAGQLVVFGLGFLEKPLRNELVDRGIVVDGVTNSLDFEGGFCNEGHEVLRDGDESLQRNPLGLPLHVRLILVCLWRRLRELVHLGSLRDLRIRLLKQCDVKAFAVHARHVR